MNIKKEIFFLLFFFVLINCNKKETNKFYYPTKEEFKKLKNIDSFQLDQFRSYKNLIDTLWYYRKHLKNTPIFIIKNLENQYFLKTLDLPRGCMPPVFKLKNIIAISKDSVFHSNNYYPKDSLKFILKTNLLNYGKNYKFADSPDRLIIKFLHPKQESMSDFENNLIEIFDSYNEIKKVTNDSLRLNIDFQEFIFLKPPPLPLVFEESE